MPAIIMVDFSYSGPASVDVEGTYVVPILPKTTQWDAGSVTCSRTQFPLHLAFAITVHKSQWLTLGKVVLNLTSSDFTPALTYVAASTVRSIYGIAIEEPFCYDRFRTTISTTVRQRIDDQRRRRGQPLCVWPEDQQQEAGARGGIQRGRGQRRQQAGSRGGVHTQAEGIRGRRGRRARAGGSRARDTRAGAGAGAG
ncbi:hypothetical protein N7G274_000452 [Stereocaulon virgatum]|uniref:ATP-dependent DNA helicase n=1 Tax=Stereocaulon virgatum TaxID=373712 RepID=A0ABR4ATF7_9LECA